MSEVHTHNAENLDKPFKTGLIFNTAFTIFEFVIGILSGSLALISDAGHNLTDSLTILIALFAQRISKREANIKHSYGYGRATIIAAFINGLILIVLSLYIFFEAIQRFMHPEPVSGNLVMIVAFIGILVNGIIAISFGKNKTDLNIRAAYINMLYDTLASISAFLAGLLIILTKLTFFDALASIVISIFLARSSWQVIKDAMHILLEGVPEGVSVESIKKAIIQTGKVKNVDDIHIWTISSQQAAMSCHIIIEDCDLDKITQTVKNIKEMLNKEYHIAHATIETELTECPPKKN